MQLKQHEKYMRQALKLAKIAANKTKANPMVGAVLVHDQRIIGQGFHEQYGGPHAEVNCVKSVRQEDKALIPSSTLYVTLEPCCILGKTPACTDLILSAGIKKLVVSVLDPNPKVAGKGIALLQKSGIEIVTGILSKEGNDLIRKFKINLNQRPYVTIKFAQSFDRYIAIQGQGTKISNALSDILVHQKRADSDAILVGTDTALIDNPKLTTRLVEGANPVRIILDRTLKIPKQNHVHSDPLPSIFINEIKEDVQGFKKYLKLEFEKNFWADLWRKLYMMEMYSVLVEGGAKTIKTLVASELWDEAIIITSEDFLENGIKAPSIIACLSHTSKLGNNTIHKVLRPYEC